MNVAKEKPRTNLHFLPEYLKIRSAQNFRHLVNAVWIRLLQRNGVEDAI